jgi:hypothetical protein
MSNVLANAGDVIRELTSISHLFTTTEYMQILRYIAPIRPTALKLLKPRPRTMSQRPTITSREEYKTDAKHMKLEKINWKDEDGKEVCHFPFEL